MSQEADRVLLRRFEPVVRYTRGEQFFPMEVDAYVRRCSLWVHRPNQLPVQLVPPGELTLEKLAEPRAHGFNAVYYLQFIEPLHLTELAAYRLREGWMRDPANQFHAGRGRLARVGYGSRLVDAMFSLSLLARGRVPGDTAAAAALAYERMIAERERYCYYGRVVRQDGWVALHYCFFYPFNDWRTGFYGANDHEADWEMIYIYLYETSDGQLCPEWVAYASHDFSGDDLRRRWDDPELEKVGEHPVIYVGAGSHASYFQQGEYLTEIELPFMQPLARFVDRLQSLWEMVRPWEQPGADKWSDFDIFRVPFVDYARGDGLSIGPGQDKAWDDPLLLDPVPDWAARYRGLWGLYAQDPFSGENAPAGPCYNRDGTVRRSWYDPLGWAGLDKVPPPHQRLERVRAQQAEIDARRQELERRIQTLGTQLRGMGVELAAMQGKPHLRRLRDERQQQITLLADQLADLRAQLAADDALSEALTLYTANIEAGERNPVRAHLHRAHQPASHERLRLNRFAETWAAISVGLIMISFVIMVLFAPEYLLFGLVALLSVIAFVEAGVRRSLTRLISGVTTALAIVSALVLLFEFFWDIIIIIVLLAGGYIMWENVRELRG